jgi:glycosyltransferase involved in cell wall biosynthesis
MRAVYELASESETHEVSSFFSTHHHSDFALTADLIMGSLNNARPKSNEVNTQIIKSTNDGLPIISFIIPCFNQADYLRELLLSIGDSTVQPHECLIINDGNSRESEVRKIYDVSTEHSHQAIKILSTENRGLSGARNVGIQFASGDYVKFIDADDLLIFGSVDRQIEIIESTKSDACVGGYLYFGHGNGYAIEVSDPFQNFRMNTCSEKDLWRIDFFLENWEQGLGIPIHSLLIKREFVVNFDETLKSKEDLDYWLRLIASGISFETYSDFVAIYRIHASQMTKGKILLQGYYFLQILANVHSYTGSDGKDMFEVTKRKMKFIDQIYGESARQLFKLLNDPKVSKGQAIGIGL